MTKDEIRNELHYLGWEINGLDCDEEVKKVYREAIKGAINCVEKCMRIKDLNTSRAVDIDFLDHYVINEDSWLDYIKDDMCNQLVEEALKTIKITSYEDSKVMRKVYTARLEVVDVNGD